MVTLPMHKMFGKEHINIEETKSVRIEKINLNGTHSINTLVIFKLKVTYFNHHVQTKSQSISD